MNTMKGQFVISKMTWVIILNFFNPKIENIFLQILLTSIQSKIVSPPNQTKWLHLLFLKLDSSRETYIFGDLNTSLYWALHESKSLKSKSVPQLMHNFHFALNIYLLVEIIKVTNIGLSNHKYPVNIRH